VSDGPGFQVRDPHYERRVRDSFDQQGLMRTLGARMTRVEPGRCTIELPFDDGLTQQDGFFHAGAIGAVADSAGGYSGWTLMPTGSRVLTVEYKLNMLAPGAGDVVIAKGAVVRAGRTLTVSKADVLVRADGEEKLCATLLQTLMCLNEGDPTGVRRSA